MTHHNIKLKEKKMNIIKILWIEIEIINSIKNSKDSNFNNWIIKS